MLEANLSAGGVGGVEEENQDGKTWIRNLVPLLCPSGYSGSSHCTDPPWIQNPSGTKEQLQRPGTPKAQSCACFADVDVKSAHPEHGQHPLHPPCHNHHHGSVAGQSNNAAMQFVNQLTSSAQGCTSLARPEELSQGNGRRDGPCSAVQDHRAASPELPRGAAQLLPFL